MPGLLRGMARTAVVAGTATAVSNRVSRRQAERWSQQDAAYAPAQGAGYVEQGQAAAEPPPQAPTRDIASQLKDLADLRDQGILTEQEFATQKARILGA